MPALNLSLAPNPVAIGPFEDAQLCYVLLRIDAPGLASPSQGNRPVNWALVADASRSMRIPIVDEAQFRALIRESGAQETLVDGVPVWQLAQPVPPDVRATARSALDHVAHALHNIVERLDAQDRFALIACAEDAVLLSHSTSGAQRAELARGIGRLQMLNLGEQTDLALGIELALAELRRSRGQAGGQAERLLLLTDGFTQRAEVCLELADAAASEGVAISTVGLGGEFQEDVLTGVADRSGGRALFLRRPDDIPRAIAAELRAARAAAVRTVALRVTPEMGTLRRVTRIRPDLTTLFEATNGTLPDDIALGDIAAGASITLLLELLAPPRGPGRAPLAQLTLLAENNLSATAELFAVYGGAPVAPMPEVLDAAARANAARLQRRALEAARTNTVEAARLLRAAAERMAALGEHALAGVARDQAAALEQHGRTNALATKELTYATRRLGGG
jgi:Ca-activated chloride channel family protein